MSKLHLFILIALYHGAGLAYTSRDNEDIKTYTCLEATTTIIRERYRKFLVCLTQGLTDPKPDYEKHCYEKHGYEVFIAAERLEAIHDLMNSHNEEFNAEKTRKILGLPKEN